MKAYRISSKNFVWPVFPEPVNLNDSSIEDCVEHKNKFLVVEAEDEDNARKKFLERVNFDSPERERFLDFTVEEVNLKYLHIQGDNEKR